MYKIIRCAERFSLVIAMSPADAEPTSKDAKFYRLANWPIGTDEPNVFNEIIREVAIGYFGGRADGLGWESCPATHFKSLNAVIKYIDAEFVKKYTTIVTKKKTATPRRRLPRSK